MPLSLVLASLWAIAANVLAMLPSRDRHWRSAFGLTAIGIPLLGYVTYQCGPLIGLLVMVAGMSVLRWPLIHLGRWVARLVR